MAGCLSFARYRAKQHLGSGWRSVWCGTQAFLQRDNRKPSNGSDKYKNKHNNYNNNDVNKLNYKRNYNFNKIYNNFGCKFHSTNLIE